MLSPNFFNTLFVFPILNLLVAFYQLLLMFKIPGAFGFAIVALTVSIRFLLHPFFNQQLQTTKKMQEIKPHMDRLTQKHKKDPKKLQEEQMKLYKQAGINPAAGCLFVIIQMPIFFALYQTLNVFLTPQSKVNIISEINKVLYFPFLKIQAIDPWFLGFNLALSPVQAKVWFYYLIPVVTGILQYFQVAVTAVPTTKEASTGEKKPDGGDFQKTMQTQMKFLFPLMIGWFSYTLPVGLSLYWNIFSIFSIIHYKRAHAKEKLSTLDVLTH